MAKSFYNLKLENGPVLLFTAAQKKVALDKTLDKLTEIIKSHFVTNQADWQPLLAATIRDRLRGGWGVGPVLVRTGNLRDHESVEGKDFPNENEASVFSTNVIAIAQDAARPFYDLSDTDLGELADTLLDALLEQW